MANWLAKYEVMARPMTGVECGIGRRDRFALGTCILIRGILLFETEKGKKIEILRIGAINGLSKISYPKSLLEINHNLCVSIALDATHKVFIGFYENVQSAAVSKYEGDFALGAQL